MNKKIIEILKNARSKQKITQEQIAKNMNVKKNTISNYETGVCEPSIDNFILMCQIYGVDPRDVITQAYDLTTTDDNENQNEFLKIFSQLDVHGKNLVCSVAKSEHERVTTMRNDLQQYITYPIAGRNGGVRLSNKDESKELSALETFLKKQGVI
ncbi:MAG: helix-turn-helix transcriptional regulator [Oscillospiraceae bacterium]